MKLPYKSTHNKFNIAVGPGETLAKVLCDHYFKDNDDTEFINIRCRSNSIDLHKDEVYNLIKEEFTGNWSIWNVHALRYYPQLLHVDFFRNSLIRRLKAFTDYELSQLFYNILTESRIADDGGGRSVIISHDNSLVRIYLEREMIRRQHSDAKLIKTDVNFDIHKKLSE